MKYFKLFLISVVVFSALLFCLSLVFPSTTYVSRAVNVKVEKNRLNDSMPELYTLAFQEKNKKIPSIGNTLDSLNLRDKDFDKKRQIVSLSINNSYGDTLISTSSFSSDIEQAVSVYTAGDDSTTVQVFYKINVPFYKPWKKFALMLNESKYGPSLDSAVNRISRQF